MIKKLFTSLRRSPYQTVAAVVIIFISFFVATIYLLSAMTAQRVLNELASRPQVIVFLKDDAKTEDIDGLKKSLNDQFKIKDMKYLSKDDALARYREQNKNDQLLLELVNANILPASLEVSAVNAVDLSKVYLLAKNSPAVEDAVYQQEETKDLLSWVNSIRISGVVLVGFLLLESILVLLIIFALKITIRREEIEVMRLVGASFWQIRAPFIFEGMFYGFIAGVLSFGLGYYFSAVLHINPLGVIPALANYAAPFDLTAVNLVIWGLAEIAGAITIGVIGSYLAVWRYLKN